MKNKILLCAFVVIASVTQAKKNEVKNGIDKIVNNSGEFSYTPFYHNSLGHSNPTNFFEEHIILNESFNNFTDNGWTIYSVTGAREWEITNFGNPAPSAFMNGFGEVNEDWLISKSIDLTSGYTSASFSFMTDGRYAGNPLEVYVTTDTYINDAVPNTVTWTKLDATIDSDMNSYSGFIPSGNIDLSTYLGKNVRIAFKYTSDSPTIAAAWEIDNFKVIATESLSVENVSSKKMKFYPNPVKEKLNFSEEVSNVKITDISGKVIKEISANGRSADVSKLEKGIYVVVATIKSGETITGKIVKE